MTIAQVSQKYGVSADTLRYYERIGLLPPVGRTKSGIRDYTEEDCNWVNFIKCMRGAGLPVETLIEYVGLFGQGDETIPCLLYTSLPPCHTQGGRLLCAGGAFCFSLQESLTWSELQMLCLLQSL